MARVHVDTKPPARVRQPPAPSWTAETGHGQRPIDGWRRLRGAVLGVGAAWAVRGTGARRDVDHRKHAGAAGRASAAAAVAGSEAGWHAAAAATARAARAAAERDPDLGPAPPGLG